jgi:hypothetical protein
MAAQYRQGCDNDYKQQYCDCSEYDVLSLAGFCGGFAFLFFFILGFDGFDGFYGFDGFDGFCKQKRELLEL